MADSSKNQEKGEKPIRKKVTVPWLKRMKQKGIKISALTAYDATFGAIQDAAGLDIILVGDSAGMVIRGQKNTISVTMDEMVFMTRSVRRGVRKALLVSDMPFGSFQVTTEETVRNAIRFMKEGRAEAVKIEGCDLVLNAIKQLTTMGVPVMGHVGLTPQSVHQIGGFKLQGTEKEEADKILEDTLKLQEAGVFSIVLEKIPWDLGQQITEKLEIPTIGIASGPYCDGQILVNYDLLGFGAKAYAFARRYMEGAELVRDAVSRYVEDIREGTFPTLDESFGDKPEK